MIREQYLEYRNTNASNPVYEYYKENFKNGTFLDAEQFFQFFQIWPLADEAYGKVLKEYDEKFNVMSIQDLKSGQMIKYL